MNRSIFGLGAGTVAMALFAVMGLTAPTTTQAGVCNGTALPDFGLTGPGPLQGVLDQATLPNPGGPSSVNVATDCLADGSDAVWQIGGSGGSVNTLVVEFAGFAGSNSFGIYDSTNPANRVQLFSGPNSPGVFTGGQHTVSITALGVVLVDGAPQGNFNGNSFGYYLDATTGNASANGFFYSDTALNADGLDHMFAYQGVGDMIQLPPFEPLANQFAAGPWGANEWLLAWEDLLGPCSTALAGGADCDYTDFVVLVESVSPVPEPASLAIVGIGLLGLGAASRRRTRRVH